MQNSVVSFLNLKSQINSIIGILDIITFAALLRVIIRGVIPLANNNIVFIQ